jgi:mxaK protein
MGVSYPRGAVAGPATAVIVLLIFAGFQLHGWLAAIAYNRAVDLGQYGEAAIHASVNGQFSSAYELVLQGQFEEAMAAYAIVMREGDLRLATSARFNVANAYFRRGRAFMEDDAADLAVPLLELAKENYRRVLRQDPEFWPARFNLARALELYPDSEMEQAKDELMPEHSRRSLVPAKAERQLP